MTVWVLAAYAMSRLAESARFVRYGLALSAAGSPRAAWWLTCGACGVLMGCIAMLKIQQIQQRLAEAAAAARRG